MMLGNEVGGRYTEARAQDAIERSWRAAALHMAQNRDANFLAQHFAQGEGNGIGHVAGSRGRDGLAVGISRRKLYALGHHDKAEALAAEFPRAHGIANVFEFKGNLRYQDDVRSTGNSRVQCDPSRVAAHYFDEHDAMMRFRGG